MTLCTVVLLSACAGTATGKKSSVYQHDASVVAIDASRSKADALVVIRYPAVVDRQSVDSYYRAFANHAIGGKVRVDQQYMLQASKIAQAVIAKSNYFAMTLYRVLQNELPAQSVLLSPHLIVADEQGQLRSEALLAAEEIPSVITIDFNVYSFPDADKLMDAPPLTFGDIVTPMFVVHSNRWLQPSTHGLLLSSGPLLPTAWAQSRKQADAQFFSRLEFEFGARDRPLDFITFLTRMPASDTDIPRKSVGVSRRDIIAVEDYPLEKIRMDGDIVARLAQDRSVDPFAIDFVNGAATRIERALNRVDHDRATFFNRQRALARFDPDLAIAFLSQTRNPEMLSRLQLGETLVAAEKRFLAAQSETLYNGTFDGDYGDQMRQMLAAELRLLEERRDLARQQNLNSALAVVAIVGSIAASSSGMDSGLSNSTVSNLLVLSSIWAMNSAMDANAKSKILNENFLVQMAPAINQQVSVQIEWLESKREITAFGFEEFRRKTQALYQSTVRSIDVAFDRQCRFAHPQMEDHGVWYGGCHAGLASATGYGLITDGQGLSVEYVGGAQSGMASGQGAMILRSPGEVGAVYMEGAFSDGLPDGVVLIEEPGRKPRVRTFKAGKDVGRADADQLDRVQF